MFSRPGSAPRPLAWLRGASHGATLRHFASLCLLLLCATLTSSCTTIDRAMRVFSADAPAGKAFTLRDGVTLYYYTHQTTPKPDATATRPAPATPPAAMHTGTAVFILGGSGCASWKALMPHYAAGYAGAAHIFAVNKRHIDDDGLGILPCTRAFHEHNHLTQWVGDYREFIDAMLAQWPPAPLAPATSASAAPPPGAPARPRHVVLVGVSEGALPAVQLAAQHKAITHLALIGFGGWSVRRLMQYLYENGRGDGTNPADIQKRIERAPASLRDEINGHPYRWWTGVFDIDPMPALKALGIPVIVGMGEEDQNVPVESARDLQRQLWRAGKRDVYLHLYPGADHRLDAAGRSYLDDFFVKLAHCVRGKCLDAPP